MQQMPQVSVCYPTPHSGCCHLHFVSHRQLPTVDHESLMHCIECCCRCCCLHLQERISGPLSVLAATWNVGNALPPPVEQLREQWLTGTAE
jgi:hypothetical protein